MKKFLRLFIFFVIGSQLLCHGQNQNESKGNLYIGNWIPATGQEGAHINSISLEYGYSVDDMEPMQQLSIIWHIGNQVIINGKSFSREEIGADLFGKISISSVSFKAKVFSSGKAVSEITIEYQNIIPKSGRKSGWYISGSPEWEKIFLNTSAEKTKEIFENGFELREPKVASIQFGGLDSIRQMLLQKEKPPNDNYSKSNHSNNSATIKRRNRKSPMKIFINDIRLDIARGNIYLYRGLSWHLNLNTGIGYMQFPMNVPAYKETVYNIGSPSVFDTFTSRKYCSVPIVKVGTEIWPVFGDHFGIGVLGNFSYGWLPGFTKASDINYGLICYGGAQPLKISLQYLHGFQFGEYSQSEQFSFENGNITITHDGETVYSYNSLGIGGIALLDLKKPLIIELTLILSQPDYLNRKVRQLSVFRLAAWTHNRIKCGVEIAPDYRAAGKARYKFSDNYVSSGFYFNIFFSKSFDFFGTKYFSSLKKGNL